MIRVGPAGWSYADWVGPIHPRGEPRGTGDLVRLLRVFPCVEINVSFYRDPSPEHQERWLQAATAHTPAKLPLKLHQRFTHERELATPRALHSALDTWRKNLAPWIESPARGPLLVQFPFSFAPTPRNVRYLAALLEGLVDLRPVLELRRKAWLEADRLDPWIERGASLAAIDLPAHDEHPPLLARGPIGYVRLHGRAQDAWFRKDATRDERYDYLYSKAELRPVAALAQQLEAQMDEVYVVTNNHFAGKAVANGVELLALLHLAPAAVPTSWLHNFEHLVGLAPGSGPAELF